MILFILYSVLLLRLLVNNGFILHSLSSSDRIQRGIV